MVKANNTSDSPNVQKIYLITERRKYMTEEKTWANISRFQTYLFNSGDNFKSYEMLGSHKVKIDGVDGWRFAVWAPKAVSVRVVGDFNDWNGYDKMLERIETSGVWYGFFTDIEEGMLYKYAIEAEKRRNLLQSRSVCCKE